MKRIALLAAIAVLVAAPAWAQSDQAKAPEKATAPLMLPAKAEAKAEAATPPTTNIKPVYRKLTKRSYLDARECLEKKTDEEIIICAEKFL